MGEPTFTIFSDANCPGWAEGFAELLREGSAINVDFADSLDAAIDGESDVLILNLGRRDDEKLSPEQVALLGKRRVIAMAPGVDWLCRQLDDLEVHGGMVSQDLPMVVVDSDLLGEGSPKVPMKPFAQPQERSEDWTPQTPLVYWGTTDIDEFRPSVDYIVATEHYDKCAVVMRHANFVYAGVCAHPREWSVEYRDLMRRVALALSRTPVSDLKPLVVERQIHPPGTVRFDLERSTHHESVNWRMFYFRFDRSTVFTATLEHAGSNAMMLLFSGGKERLHWTRVDTEVGKTLTITANISAASIRAVRHRYWMLNVTNFDSENGASAKLTIRYDTTDSDMSVLPLPGDAGFEHLNRHAQQLLEGARGGDSSACERIARYDSTVEPGRVGMDTAYRVTAREFGFNDWTTIKSHVAWTPVWLPKEGTRGVDISFAQASERYVESFSFEELIEFTGDFNDDVIDSLKEAFAQARARGHRSLVGEHLLLALLTNPISDHVLRSVGCKFDRIPAKIDALLARLPVEPLDGDVQVSRSAWGPVYRANFVNALGRDGTNAGNLLAGVVGEKGDAARLLNECGVYERDLVNYVSHGIASVLASDPHPSASVLAPDLERAAHDAFLSAQSSRHEYLTIEHLLLAMLGSQPVLDTLESFDAGNLGRDLATFIEAGTPVVSAPGDGSEPTRTFNRVMQMALAKARSRERDQANTLDALWALCGERDVPSTDFLTRCGVTRATVAPWLS
ncbi:MAG: hypothetical protein OXK76_13505 [Gammaproteobacteria bacterium]|nr:hypothetical protein [Gammaproteobacteria bacterium]